MHEITIAFFVGTIAAASFAFGMVKPEVSRVARPVMYGFIALLAGSFAFV